jgi:hypothetical protein
VRLRPDNTALSCEGRATVTIADLVSFNALLYGIGCGARFQERSEPLTQDGGGTD